MLKLLAPLCAAIAVSSCVGAPGPAGPPGPAGADGQDGTNGTNGMNGTNGADGADGMNGVDGMNGTNGVDGAQGPTGPQGPAGAQGPAGPPGADFDAGVPMPLPVLGQLRMERGSFSASYPVLSYAFSASLPSSLSGGAGGGKVRFDETIVTISDANAARLSTAIVNANPFTTVAIDLPVADGGVEPFLSMGTAVFTELRALGTTNAEEGPLWELKFAPGQVALSWDGRTSAWDVVANTGTCGTGCGCTNGQTLGPYAQSTDWSWPAPTGDARAWTFDQQTVVVVPTGSGGGAATISPGGASVSTPLTAQGVCSFFNMAAGQPFAPVRVDLLGAPTAPPQPTVDVRYTACGTVFVEALAVSSRDDGPAAAFSVRPSAYLYETMLPDGGMNAGGYNAQNGTSITACP